ncbi:MAG: LptF/LptG family permease [Gemmatimonas sp.]
MKIITRYVLREHLGPLIFSLTALTSLLMLQFVARQLGNLVGKGLPWRVIGEFFVLSLPFTVAMTLPMAVLVATLHAFGRMATEHEITAFKASGVRVTSLMFPVTVGAAVLALGMVVFNDQVLPRANHRLRILQQDMARTKPTFALNEQVLNQVTTSVYLRIGRLDRESNKMTDVTLYDMSDPFNHKTIYADSGDLAVTPDQKDLQLMLFDGFQQELKGDTKHGLQRSYFRSQAVRVKDVGGGFEQTGNDDWKGDREKSVCEMQSEYVGNAREYERVRQLYIITASRAVVASGKKTITAPRARPATGGLAKLYCNGLALVFRTQTAVPSDPPLLQPVAVVNPSPTNARVVTPDPGALVAGATVAGAVITPGAVPGVPGTVTGGAVPLSPALQAQLDAEKASIAALPQSADTLVQQAARVKQIVAQQAAQQAAIVAEQQARQKAEKPVFKPMADGSTGDSAKVQAVVIGGKPDSTAPTTPRVSVPVTKQIPPLVAGAIPPTSVVTTPATIAPGQPATNPATSVQPAPGQPPVQPIGAPPTSVAVTPAPLPATVAAPSGHGSPPSAIAPAPATAIDPNIGSELSLGAQAELNSARSQLTLVRASMDSLAVEIQKKFALSFACIVFVLFGPPIALRFPRGGVGATLGISLVVFGLYYICLMAGETLADDGKLPPIIAMWIANVIFTIAGLLLLVNIETTADASRGGGIRAWFEERRMRRANRRRVRVAEPTVAV